MGATLTTTGSQGFLLVSFLTLFVRMAGGHFWSILCFVLHQFKSSAAPQDGLHHQHQLLLRNSQSHTSTLWDLIKVSIYWRSNAKRGFWRTLPLITLALLHLCIWTGASLFSSHVASTSNEVLVQSPYCGYVTFPNTTSGQISALDNTGNADNYIYRRTRASLSSSYARSCYANVTRPPTKQEKAWRISGWTGIDSHDQVVILRIRHLPELGPPADYSAARILGVVYQGEEAD